MTDSLGFQEATQEDQERWLNSFRSLLDGMKHPFQIVAEYPPPSFDREQADGSPVRGCFGHHSNPWSQRTSVAQRVPARRVVIVSQKADFPQVRAAMDEMGLGQIGWPQPARNGEAAGTEEIRLFIDDDGYHRTWQLERFPGTDLEPGWVSRLIPEGLFVTLSWHIRPLPPAWVARYLQRHVVSMRAAKMQEAVGGAIDAAVPAALTAAETLQQRLLQSQEKAFHVALYLTLSAADREVLNGGSARVESCGESALCQIRPCTLRMYEGRLATLPLGEDRIGRCHVLDTSALVTMFPWLEAEVDEPDGFWLGRNARTGSPVVLNPFDESRYPNANIAVFGHSGAGKTYLLTTIALEALSRGVQVLIIDPEHEYGDLALRMEGLRVELALGSEMALNVLGSQGNRQSDPAWLSVATADAVDLAGVICGDLDQSERAFVEAAVREAYAELREPVLGDVAERVPTESRVSRILKRWSSGALGSMFSRPTNIDLEAPLVVFGMRELREELVGPVHFLLAQALWRMIKARGRRRLLVVDELGLLFEDPTMRGFVVRLARRIRKYEGSLVFATQNPGDLLSSDAGSVVATNPAIQLLGAQKPGEVAKLARVFNLSSEQCTFLGTSRRGDFLLAAGSRRLRVRVQAPAWQRPLISQRGAELAAI